MKPLLSVIIPAYNEEKRIGRCLESIIKQTYPKEKFEIIVVDNNSSDKTAAIALSYDVRVIKFTDMQAIGAARSYGASHAQSDILAFIDSDSIASPEWLASIADLMDNERLQGVCGIGLPIKHTKYLQYLFSLYHIFLQINQIFGRVLPWGFNMAIKKKAFEEVGGFNTALMMGEDWDLALRIQQKYGRKSIFYSKKLQVYTSTRKQEHILGSYIWDGIINYINIVLLRRVKGTTHKTVR